VNEIKSIDFWENWYPTIIGTMLAILGVALYKNGLVQFQRDVLLNTVLTVSAIVVGAIYTNKSILFSIQNTRAIKHLKDAGLYGLFLQYTFRAINCSAIAVIASVILLVIKPESVQDLYPLLKYFWVWITSVSCVALFRANNCLTTMLVYEDGK
jgi:hypothetical protein